MAWRGEAGIVLMIRILPGRGAVRPGLARHGRAGRGRAGIKTMKIKIAKIVIDESIYPRNSVSQINVDRLRSALKTGAKLPPLVTEAKTHRLVDGRHRLAAYQQQSIETCEIIEKVYANEAELFADAIRCNVGHGEPLDHYSIRRAILRLTTEYGYQRESVSEIVRLPVPQIEHIEKGFAARIEDGKPFAVKGGLPHLAGMALSADQREVVKHYSGGKAVFQARQLADLLEHDMWPRNSSAFATEMNRLTKLWLQFAGTAV